ILRSGLPHARIVRLGASRALEHPGVVGVLTGADVAAMSKPFPVGVENAPPYYAAANEVARYAGEPLAVVVARDRYVAEDALELIDVEYEPLEAVVDPERGQVVHERSFSYGDPDAAFVAADLVVSERFFFPRWTEDRLEHLAGSSASTARSTGVEAAFASDGELLAIRYDVVEDVGAYIRAPEPASLYRMQGSLTGAYRVGHVATRNRVALTN